MRHKYTHMVSCILDLKIGTSTESKSQNLCVMALFPFWLLQILTIQGLLALLSNSHFFMVARQWSLLHCSLMAGQLSVLLERVVQFPGSSLVIFLCLMSKSGLSMIFLKCNHTALCSVTLLTFRSNSKLKLLKLLNLMQVYLCLGDLKPFLDHV